MKVNLPSQDEVQSNKEGTRDHLCTVYSKVNSLQRYRGERLLFLLYFIPARENYILSFCHLLCPS